MLENSFRRLGRASGGLPFALGIRKADLAVFHKFPRGPGGGGHQFLRGLLRVLETRGLTVEHNRISRATPACLFNSFNFDFQRLRRFRRAGCRMVHRVDGPIGVYRGFDDGTDARIHALNRELADATIFQSEFSLVKHRELGLECRDPTVILNAADPLVFGRKPAAVLPDTRKLRIIATSWSANPRKGAAVYRWLDDNLDWNKHEFTFVGQTGESFSHIRHLPPVDSRRLAALLHEHDVFLTASQDDPCSNSLIEALSCGLPAVYRKSGGHPEIVRNAGLGFNLPDEIPELVAEIARDYTRFCSAIDLPTLDQVTDRYLEVLQVQPR